MENRILWCDLETTGLDPETNTILEAAFLLTNDALQILDELQFVIRHPKPVLTGMSEWCLDQHGKTGLIWECQRSTLTLEAAEKWVLDWLDSHEIVKPIVLAGSTVASFDRQFIRILWGNLHARLHHRNIDVSTLRELDKRWSPEPVPKGTESNHRALSDIKFSLRQLRLYKRRGIIGS